MTQLYGSATDRDKLAEENLLCRQIVKEIGDFGVSQRQTLMIMYLLAMELENHEHVRTLSQTIRNLDGVDIFLIGPSEPEQEIDTTKIGAA